MLNMEKVQQMTDMIHTSIPYSGIEHSVISTPIYNRLHRVLQSSLVFLTYPSNKVKRFEHSVGTMHLAGEMFFNSICNASPETLQHFIDKISQELMQWRSDINFEKYSFVERGLRNKYKDDGILSAPVPNSKFYNKYIPGNLLPSQRFAFCVTLQAVRLAGLLHDVGHLPYSHILEHALKKMYETIKDKTDPLSNVEQEFLDIMVRFAEGDDEIHEEIGKLLVNNIRNSITQDNVDRTDPCIFFFLASFDFAEKIVYSKFSDNTIFSDLHLITASVVDADRMDYCTRDAFCSGTNKSIYPYERILATYKLNEIGDEGSKRFYFCPAAKSISSIEDLLKRRFNIFSDINYHHRVHKHEILLEEVICTLGVDELTKMETNESLPSTMPLHVSSIWKLISKLDSSNDWPEYQIIQLDDSWLDTLLKHEFFNKYGMNYLSLRDNGNDILWNRFDELISTTKRYHSFLKRANDFREFDKLFFSKLKEVTLDRYTEEKIPRLTSYNDFYNSYHSFLFNYLVENLFTSDTYKIKFLRDFETVLNDSLKKSNLHINDCLLRSCMFSFGYQTAKTPLFLSDSNNETIRIEQISSQLETFQKERAISPIFHLYYLPSYNQNYNVYEPVDKECFLDTIADCAILALINPGA